MCSSAVLGNLESAEVSVEVGSVSVNGWLTSTVPTAATCAAYCSAKKNEERVRSIVYIGTALSLSIVTERVK